jgi:hypothetical protein
MNTVVLLGTSHSIQLGDDSHSLFKELLCKEFENHNIKGVAEEIKKGDITIASTLATELHVPHLYADPNEEERMERGIPNGIELDLIKEYGDSVMV